MESTPMPKTDERKAKTIEFSPMGNGSEITGKTPEKNKRQFPAEEDILHGENC